MTKTIKLASKDKTNVAKITHECQIKLTFLESCRLFYQALFQVISINKLVCAEPRKKRFN